MRSWLTLRLLAFVMRRTRSGDIRPTLALDHPDVRFTFPGDNSWSGMFVGKAEVGRWLRRLADVGIKTYPDAVVVSGPPWNTTLCLRGHDHYDAPDGERVYENRFVIWGQLRWGRLREYEVYEDTARADRLDAWLSEHGLARLPTE